jgi:hypothetical protein
MVLGRDVLGAPIERRIVDVPMPELGGEVRLREMDAGEVLGHYASVQGKDAMQDRAEVLARLVVKCLVDDNGERVFTDDEWETVTHWPNSALQRAAGAAMRLNTPPEGEDGENFPDSDGSSSDLP